MPQTEAIPSEELVPKNRPRRIKQRKDQKKKKVTGQVQSSEKGLETCENYFKLLGNYSYYIQEKINLGRSFVMLE